MDVSGITPEAVSAQKLALTQSEIGVRVFRMALDAQSQQAMEMVRMMDQAQGLGTRVDTTA